MDIKGRLSVQTDLVSDITLISSLPCFMNEEDCNVRKGTVSSNVVPIYIRHAQALVEVLHWRGRLAKLTDYLLQREGAFANI
ncbi:hypothetical protein CEXT_25731 [Caerostris extrusa]|uniref:Uncharacterized protein n=1 Tax=Caerostris extrusa TaxID=172846 RepID=A0AAV4Y5H5_CAEEX|nr:hypothetical protein CEXT_25731 [Caerostris extrusa]